VGRLSHVDLALRLSSEEETARLLERQRRLLQLRLALGGLLEPGGPLGPPLCVLFEGWDASGKGGAIRRLAESFDPRHVRVVQFGPPTPDEKRHHWLSRFVPSLPGWGGVAVLDRSWYGRVLVERVEGFASTSQWRRAYEEIVTFERLQASEGMVLVKMFLHISPDEQLRRFERRAQDPLRRWKLTDDDWRNRERWDEYVTAIEDMFEHTDHAAGPWTIIPAESKRWARVAVIDTVITAVETAMAEHEMEIPPPIT
jgi:polyphosphate kinase 2 (PPK2 family)